MINKFLEKVAQNAYVDEMQKIAGIKTELFGTISQPAGFPVGYIAALLTKKRTPDQLKKQNKKTWSNILIPFAAPYRLSKRMDVGIKSKTSNK